MAPAKWDDEESSTPPSSPPVVTQRRKFDDEEDSDDVLDSWEAAEDSEVEREKEAKAAAAKAKAEAEALANKKSRSQRRAEHIEAAARRRALEDEESSDEEEEDLATQRARMRRTEKDADLGHAQDLIGDIDLNKSRGAPKTGVISDQNDPTKSIDLSAIPLFKPATKTQFTELTNTLIPLLTAQSKKPQYSLWVQDFAKQLVKGLPSQDIKKVASALTAASNEKLKEEKAADKGGKKTKAAKTKTSLVTQRDTARADLTAYDGDELDDDDFM